MKPFLGLGWGGHQHRNETWRTEGPIVCRLATGFGAGWNSGCNPWALMAGVKSLSPFHVQSAPPSTKSLGPDSN